MICGRAKENLVVEKGCWDADHCISRAALVCAFGAVRSVSAYTLCAILVTYAGNEVAWIHGDRFLEGNKTCSPSRGKIYSSII